MAGLLLHDEEAVQQCAVQAVANLGVDASDAKTFLASGWHLSLISLLSAATEETQAEGHSSSFGGLQLVHLGWGEREG